MEGRTFDTVLVFSMEIRQSRRARACAEEAPSWCMDSDFIPTPSDTGIVRSVCALNFRGPHCIDFVRQSDGLRDIALTDPATGATSTMTGAITYGAGPNDTIKLLAGSNPTTPRGGEAQNPIRVQVLDANGSTPISGATVVFSAVPAAGFSACANATTCTVVSDDNGEVSTRVTALTAGTMTITAQLAPASYSPAKQIQTTLFASNSSVDISLSSPSVWIAQGATVDVALSAKVLASGVGSSGRTVNYSITQGTGTLSSTTATTNSAESLLQRCICQQCRRRWM